MPTKKPARIGRPPLPKGEVKKVTPIRFPDNERAVYEGAARQAGLSLSEWIRQTLRTAVGEES